MRVEQETIVAGAAGDMDFDDAVQPQAIEGVASVEAVMERVGVKIEEVEQQATARAFHEIVQERDFISPKVGRQTRHVIHRVFQQEWDIVGADRVLRPEAR